MFNKYMYKPESVSIKRHRNNSVIKEINKDLETKLKKQCEDFENEYKNESERMIILRNLSRRKYPVDGDVNISHFIYILREREFELQNKNVFKVGYTSRDIKVRCQAYPKGSKVFCSLPMKNDYEKEILTEFRETFIPRVDVGAETFEGDFNIMFQILKKYTY
jgi:hypothetical protein